MLPVRFHDTDLDCVGKYKNSICWVLFQKKQTAESDKNKWSAHSKRANGCKWSGATNNKI